MPSLILGDLNTDGAVDNVDVQPFVSLLLGGPGSPVPKPSAGELLVVRAMVTATAHRSPRSL